MGCRGDGGRAAPGAGSTSSPASTRPTPVIVPNLPPSPDGAEELRALDRRIELHRDESALAIGLLLERAWIRGRLEDYLAALQRSEQWVASAPKARRAWQTRAQVLTRVHEFAAARAALDQLRALAREPGDVEGLAAAIDEATGAPGAAAYREKLAHDYPDPTTLTQWAASLAAAGRTDDALAVMQKVPAAFHDNPPQLLAWVLFQWGRIYEQKGAPAAARAFYEAARARLPIVDASVHLAQVMRQAGDDPRALVSEALAADRHPELLALAGQLDEAKRAWERYVAALPRAFAGRAARFYLDAGEPARALALARLDHANRDTAETRTLLAEAALAAGEPATACEIAARLADGAPAQQFLAWRAYTRCGRTGDAAALAARLGIR
jgi:tetratricopeptide (TPR) repeat protein